MEEQNTNYFKRIFKKVKFGVNTMDILVKALYTRGFYQKMELINPEGCKSFNYFFNNCHSNTPYNTQNHV